jgi:exopolysaccharide production protein ExoZ
LIRHPFDHQRLLVFGIPALLIMLGAAAPAVNNLRIPRWASFLGDASYSIYLIHILVLDTFQVGYLRIHALRALPFDLYYAILVSTAIIAGVVTYLLIEKPLLNLRPKRAASSTVRLSPATTT